MKTNDFIFKICLVYVQHMKACIEYGSGWNTDIFIYLLNKKEEDLISIGTSIKMDNHKETHLEHIVPRLVLLMETRRLLKEEKLSDEDIAKLLQKHWKVARITREEQQELDSKDKLNLKQTMPKEWTFENGDTFARLKIAGITLIY